MVDESKKIEHVNTIEPIFEKMTNPVVNPNFVYDDDIDSNVEPKPFDRQQRPQSTRTNRSITSRSSVNNADGRIHCFDYHASKFFSYKDQGFEKALSLIHKILFPNQELSMDDRNQLMKRSWLLTDIDHWDMHREVIVTLMQNHILIVRYNFIRNRIIYTQSIRFDDIKSVVFGPYKYPPKSIMGEYIYGGCRIVHGEEPTFLERWNPFIQTGSHTFTSHHLAYNDKEKETTTYNCDEFIESLETALNTYRRDNNLPKLEFTEEQIVIPSYASLASVIFNQNFLGFNRDRNGVNW
ncbi:unnamed protein product [Didymodactylos carnosus]|uniref:Inositol phosphatase domain-containing protein n=1 Tax=Didymodactylos carnosus TaxID=1234261 RepID=A0A813PM02_9BILA|nr:unnamed protein product [Didymodactylos carnosus]CAF0781752.1 unnamed protein product [Didymodactylos carnosus]CAF3530293.1 unnamed protein product [Didymodactylos carnosus]CAF3563494.1 unnamed protein product [Didymodactylos carnosus]